IKEAFEHRLLELEIEGQKEEIPTETYQITLNGKVVDDSSEEPPHTRSRKDAPGVQAPLTEFEKKKAPKRKAPARPKMKSPGTKRRKKSKSKKGAK
ncbi:MAG: hypothetical protein JSW61_01855, partial [Candidatus Thorarchaeota archaeon]